MYNADVFMKNACEVANANVLYINGNESKVEYKGKTLDATYDEDYKMFVVADDVDVTEES